MQAARRAGKSGSYPGRFPPSFSCHHCQGEERCSFRQERGGSFLEDYRSERESQARDGLRAIAEEVFGYLGKTFPVCCASDEFFYFPQVIPPEETWSGWDDFSRDRIEEVTRRLSSVENDLGLLSRNSKGLDVLTDAEILRRMSRTLREQLQEVRFHETQPTFHLTILCTGLSSSLENDDHRAWEIRARAVPSFLERARETLTDMPRLFRDQGLAMIRDMKAWLRSLDRGENDLSLVVTAFSRFEDFLRNAGTRSHYLLPSETVERIVKEHVGCGVGPGEVRHTLMEEIREMGKVMEEVCEGLCPGTDWREAVRKISPPEIPGGGPQELYREEADRILRHCVRIGIVPEDLPRMSPLRVEPLPPYLRTIRAASAYSFTPENRLQTGTFYIVPPGGEWDDNREDLVDYRMLTAHETYPGHHLLDSWRWRFVSPTRRPLESPLFYEGWACFAEELMRSTGYFSGPVDLLLLAKRRYRRAVRGIVDLDLQSGKRDRHSAASFLADSGFSHDAASSVAGKYPLRPGYQVCYTLGLKRFLALYNRYGTGDVRRFVESVLSCGEIGFDLVENDLRKRFE